MSLTEGPGSQLMPAESLIGMKVVNMMDDDLGKIEDIMLDTEKGNIAYAVLTFGGFLGMGNKLFAIPWKALRFFESKDQFILDVSKDRLEKAPGFDPDNPPDMANLEWSANIHSYYETKPYWK